MTRPALPTAGGDPSADALARVIAARRPAERPARPFVDAEVHPLDVDTGRTMQCRCCAKGTL